jgi:hypothetical protein
MHIAPQISRGGMRRLCALFLLLLFVAPWLLTFAAPVAITEASLPACCRAHGKHKCFMRSLGQGRTTSTSSQPTVSQVSEGCPYNPSFVTTRHSDSLGQPSKNAAVVGLGIAPSPVVNTVWPPSPFSSLANCKRGPPSPDPSRQTMNDWPAAQQWPPLHWRHDAQTTTDISSFRPNAYFDPVCAA